MHTNKYKDSSSLFHHWLLTSSYIVISILSPLSISSLVLFRLLCFLLPFLPLSFLELNFKIFHISFISMLFTVFPNFQHFHWSIHIIFSNLIIINIQLIHWFSQIQFSHLLQLTYHPLYFSAFNFLTHLSLHDLLQFYFILLYLPS